MVEGSLVLELVRCISLPTSRCEDVNVSRKDQLHVAL